MRVLNEWNVWNWLIGLIALLFIQSKVIVDATGQCYLTNQSLSFDTDPTQTVKCDFNAGHACFIANFDHDKDKIGYGCSLLSELPSSCSQGNVYKKLGHVRDKYAQYSCCKSDLCNSRLSLVSPLKKDESWLGKYVGGYHVKAIEHATYYWLWIRDEWWRLPLLIFLSIFSVLSVFFCLVSSILIGRTNSLYQLAYKIDHKRSLQSEYFSNKLDRDLPERIDKITRKVVCQELLRIRREATRTAQHANSSTIRNDKQESSDDSSSESSNKKRARGGRSGFFSNCFKGKSNCERCISEIV